MASARARVDAGEPSTGTRIFMASSELFCAQRVAKKMGVKFAIATGMYPFSERALIDTTPRVSGLHVREGQGCRCCAATAMTARGSKPRTCDARLATIPGTRSRDEFLKNSETTLALQRPTRVDAHAKTISRSIVSSFSPRTLAS